MKSLTQQARRYEQFLFVVQSVVAFFWLKTVVKVVVHTASGKEFPWVDFAADGAFNIVVTFAMVYFMKRYKTQIRQALDQVKLFRKNPHPMWICDSQSLKFIYTNEAALSLYRYTEEEFTNLSLDAIRLKEDMPALVPDNQPGFAPDEINFTGTWRHQKKNGEVIYVELSSNAIIRGGRKCHLVLGHNVTEKVLQDQELQMLNQKLEMDVKSRTKDLLNLNTRLVDQNKIIKSANLELFTITQQLQEANKSIQENADLKSRFVSMASHEFRIPLANIKSSAGSIRQYFNDDTIESKIRSIEMQVTHMMALLDDVLTIGKTEAKKLDVKIHQVLVREFIDGIISEVTIACNASHIIHLSITNDVQRYVHSDEMFLRNIFINLLNNAVKYSPRNRNVFVNVYNSDDGLCFDVKDGGPGIALDERDKIFEAFYRIECTKSIQGTGLGLSIVKKAADLVNARIDVKSEVGKGSVFSVILPYSNEKRVVENSKVVT